MSADRADLQPLPPAARAWATLAISAATFMNTLNMAIANVSLPSMSGDLGVSPHQATWVITSFAVANAIAMPLTGWLAHRFGQVRVFVWSILLFVIATWMCGLAWNMGTLVGFRTLQGLVSGPVLPLAQSLLLSSYPPALAALGMSLWTMTTMLAPITGPLLGGWITETIGWPWIFYVNVPVGLLSAFAVWGIYRHRESAIEKRPIDFVGLALLVVWVVAFQLMLEIGRHEDWFASTEVVALAVVAGVAFAFFIVWEWTDDYPVVDLRLFKGLEFTIGTFASATSYGVFFSSSVLLPLWLQQHMGYTATDAGMVLAPVGIFAVILSPIVGRRLTGADPRGFATISFVLLATVMVLRSHFNTQADFATIVVPTLLQGVAMPFMYVPLVTLAIAGMAQHHHASASGIMNFARMIAGAIGTSVTFTLWESRASTHRAQLAEALTTTHPALPSALDTLGAAGLNAQQSHAYVDRLLEQQAYMLATSDVFGASALLMLLLVPVLWVSRWRR
ncbi:DHA2 family efflux MFS transporter permease subunit [Ramlibacter sp.]|uniref:DHA2 family efflux MFS transporter permease subunit n=1 Tax=Ramlibacter sp. TaxID=1917967 RepID=UPI003D0FA74D